MYTQTSSVVSNIFITLLWCHMSAVFLLCCGVLWWPVHLSYVLRGTFRDLIRFTHVDHMLCVSVLSCFSSTIRISRKGWHMLLNFCFHTALTFAVFAGGINRIKYPIICQAVSLVPFHLLSLYLPLSDSLFQYIAAPKNRLFMCSGVYGACFWCLMHTASDLNENALQTWSHLFRSSYICTLDAVVPSGAFSGAFVPSDGCGCVTWLYSRVQR